MIVIRPSYYASTSRPIPEISVDVGEDGDGDVYLVIEADAKETFDDRDLSRVLTPDEARNLAAILWHSADMAERR